jgi:hypothetical protein
MAPSFGARVHRLELLENINRGLGSYGDIVSVENIPSALRLGK